MHHIYIWYFNNSFLPQQILANVCMECKLTQMTKNLSIETENNFSVANFAASLLLKPTTKFYWTSSVWDPIVELDWHWLVTLRLESSWYSHTKLPGRTILTMFSWPTSSPSSPGCTGLVELGWRFQTRCHTNRFRWQVTFSWWSMEHRPPLRECTSGQILGPQQCCRSQWVVRWCWQNWLQGDQQWLGELQRYKHSVRHILTSIDQPLALLICTQQPWNLILFCRCWENHFTKTMKRLYLPVNFQPERLK